MEAIPNGLYDINNKNSKEMEYGYFAELRRAKDDQQLTAGIHNIVKRLGFSDYAFINLKCTRAKHNVLNTLPTAMYNKYFELKLNTHDMTIQRGLTDDTAFLSSTIHRHVANAPFISDMTESMNTLYQLNKSFGFYDYLSVPCHTNSGFYMLSVAIRGASPTEFSNIAGEAKQSLVLLAEAIEFAVNKQFPDLLPDTTPNTSINAKPLRVLSTLANNDLTIEQVADKLCISVVTANQHLKTVRRKLGVKTNYAAIRHSLAEGLIELEGGPKQWMKKNP